MDANLALVLLILLIQMGLFLEISTILVKPYKSI